MSRWPTLPDRFVIGSRVWLNALQVGSFGYKLPAKFVGRTFQVELVDYERDDALPWSLWYVRFIDPGAASIFHDEVIDWVGETLTFTGLRLEYRTLYESALARAIVEG